MVVERWSVLAALCVSNPETITRITVARRFGSYHLDYLMCVVGFLSREFFFDVVLGLISAPSSCSIYRVEVHLEAM